MYNFFKEPMFWLSAGSIVVIALLVAFVVRYVIPRETLRDQWLMGSLGALYPLFTVALMDTFYRWAGTEALLSPDDVSLSELLLGYYVMLTVCVLIAAIALPFMIPRERIRTLGLAFGIGGMIGLFPFVLRSLI